MKTEKTFRNKLSIAKQYFINKIYAAINNQKLKSVHFDFDSNYKDGILKLNNFSLCCRREDFHIIMETCICDDYQKIKEMKIKEGDIVFDLGAQIGSFAVMAAKLGAKVYSFEPNKTNYGFLEKNIKINNLEGKIIPFNIGIYSFDGKVGLNTETSNTGGYSIEKDNESNGEEIEVKKMSTVMSENNIKKINLLKIDVEGSEFEIFKGDFNSLHIEKIVGEYHQSWQKPNGYRDVKKLLTTYNVSRYFPTYFYAIKNKFTVKQNTKKQYQYPGAML